MQWPQLPPPLPQRPAVPDSSPPASTQPGLPAPASRAVPGPAAGGDAQDLSSLPCADHLSHDLDADGHPASECRQREASAAAPQAQRPVQAPSASCLRHTGSPAAGLHQQQSDDAAQPSFCARAAHITAPSIAAAPHASKQSQSPAAQQAPAGAAACDHSQLQMQPTPLQQVIAHPSSSTMRTQLSAKARTLTNAAFLRHDLTNSTPLTRQCQICFAKVWLSKPIVATAGVEQTPVFAGCHAAKAAAASGPSQFSLPATDC